MQGTRLRAAPLAFLAMLLVGCAVAAPESASAPRQNSPAAPTTSPQPTRTLVIAVGRQPESLGSKPLRELRGPGVPDTALRMFNAGFALNDQQENPLPYLAEALPKADTDSWTLAADGTMQTTYRLRSSLTWQDGEPLTAADFAFAYQVYSTPDLGTASSAPIGSMSAVEALDPRTVRVSWKSIYAMADDLQAADFPPLPEHILGSAYARANWDAFVALPFWLGEYVGAGPYKLVQWEPGAFIEGEAFAAHALGRPKIDRIRVVGINDPNTTVANLLANSVHVALDQSIKDEQAAAVEAQWAPTHSGYVVRSPVTVRAAHFQMRSEFAKPPAVLDLRVRQAIAYSTDRQAIADTVTIGGGTITPLLLLPQSEFYADADRATAKQLYDLQRAEQLMADAGYRKDSDGFYTSPTAGRYTIEIAVTDSNPSEGTVFVDGLRRGGIDASLRVIPRAQTTEPLIFSNFSGILDGAVNATYLPPVEHFRAASIARAETRYLGDNFAGFNDPEFERLAVAWDTTLDRSRRHQLAVQLVQRLGDQLPAFGLYAAMYDEVVVANVRGPGVVARTNNSGWNIHEWEWTS